MSYGFMPYRVDIRSLDESFGATKLSEINYLAKQCRQEIDQLRFSFDQCPVAALRSFAKGKIDPELSGSLYWYIYELLVRQSGYLMSNSCWSPAGLDDLPTSSLSHFDIDHPFMPLSDDFPAVYVCKNGNLDAWQAEAEQKVEDSSQLKELKRWVAMAKNEGQDIIVFNY